MCVLSFKTEAENIKRSEQCVQFMLTGTREKAWPGKNGGEEKKNKKNKQKQPHSLWSTVVEGGAGLPRPLALVCQCGKNKEERKRLQTDRYKARQRKTDSRREERHHSAKRPHYSLSNNLHLGGWINLPRARACERERLACNWSPANLNLSDFSFFLSFFLSLS